MKITHLSIYQISSDGVFDNVNSYKEMNDIIKLYGEEYPEDYNNRVGMSFEIFTQFFSMKYGSTPLLGMKNIQDTSDDAFTRGYDFTFTDLNDNPGQIQSKWRGNPSHQFTLGELANNSAIASDMDISKDNNILFINIDDSDNLFHYEYRTARNKRRVIGRNAQEEFILRDPKFWDDFRKCIKESAKNEFVNPFTPRDIQEWVLNGTIKDGVTYDGTESVLSGKYDKGRIEVSTGGGKTLCQFYNIDKSFNQYEKNVAVMILPTRSLINQTFKEFYKWKMFGYEEKGKIIDTGVSCLIIMSGGNPRYNNQVANVLQELNPEKCVKFIEEEISKNRKVVIFTTMRSHTLKYEDIVNNLREKNIRVGLEIVDEYHNVISNSSDRKTQLEIAEYLKNSKDRCDGSLFYSASNKDGQILSSFNEDLFGPLLCKVNRNDLKIRGYVSPRLIFKIVKVKPISNSSESKRDSVRIGLDMDSAQIEEVGIISAYNDLKNYYENPNMITFGDHVEGCRYIANNEHMSIYLPGVSNHFMAAETSNSERDMIIEKIKNSGGNILHQHSVAKEGINLPNLHGSVFGRDMSIIGSQQGIGRSDRVLYDDTVNFQKGIIKLDDPTGWNKYYNVIYLIVDNDETFANRLKMIVKYLLDSGIPEDEWDISVVDDDGKNKVEKKTPDFSPSISMVVKFDSDKFKKMIERVKIEIIEEEKKIQVELEDSKERDRLNSMSKLDLLKEKLKN